MFRTAYGVQLFLSMISTRPIVCPYNYYYWVLALRRARNGASAWRVSALHRNRKLSRRGEEHIIIRLLLKQFRNFPKPFLSALIKFVQSKPIIYENKTIWKRWWRCSNALSAPPSSRLTLSFSIFLLSALKLTLYCSTLGNGDGGSR